jgi:hypothetical protein
MKTTHRSRRNVRTPQPGTIGAPFQGAFAIKVQSYSQEDEEIVIQAVAPNAIGDPTEVSVWPPGKIIDPAAIQMFEDTVEVTAVLEPVNVTGSQFVIKLQDFSANRNVFVRPGHPGLLSAAGMQCGGLFGEF